MRPRRSSLFRYGLPFGLLAFLTGVRPAFAQASPGASRLDFALQQRLWTAARARSLLGPNRPNARQLGWFLAEDVLAQQSLAQLGIQAPLGRWHQAEVSPGQMAYAVLAPGALSVRAARPHVLQGALAREASHWGGPWSERDLKGHYTGRGVVVGVVDTGIDLQHPAFVDAAGKSRVVAFWNQSAATGPAPKKFGYGQVCWADSLAAGTCPLRDPRGHGTHVAAIAAGNADVAYGLAPEAELVVVQSQYFDRLADAAAFVFDVARQRGRPAVVNLSVGVHEGPHDGESPTEQAIGALTGPGRIVVVAAGNDGRLSMHAAATLTPGRPQYLGLFPRQSKGREAAQMGWQPGAPLPPTHVPGSWSYLPNVPFRLEVWGDAELDATAALSWWSGGSQLDRAALTADFGHQTLFGRDHRPAAEVSWGRYRQHRRGRPERRGLELEVVPLAYGSLASPHGAGFVLELVQAQRPDRPLAGQPNSHVEAWVVDADNKKVSWQFARSLASAAELGALAAAPARPPAQDAASQWILGDDDATTIVPGNTAQVLTAGSYGVQSAWRDVQGRTQWLKDIVLDAASPFSSRGSRRNTPATAGLAAKPDLYAPGAMVASARASSVPPGPLVLPSGEYMMQGTSMSAPHVSGAVALLLQHNPRLTTGEARALLVASAVKRASAFAQVHGAGRLDVQAALQLAEEQAAARAQRPWRGQPSVWPPALGPPPIGPPPIGQPALPRDPFQPPAPGRNGARWLSQ